jgi:hypothetical protein
MAFAENKLIPVSASKGKRFHCVFVGVEDAACLQNSAKDKRDLSHGAGADNCR